MEGNINQPTEEFVPVQLVEADSVSSKELDQLGDMLDTPDRGLFDAVAKAAKDALQAVRDGGDMVKVLQVIKTMMADTDVRITYRVAKLIAVRIGATAIISMTPQAMLIEAWKLWPEIQKIVDEERKLNED